MNENNLTNQTTCTCQFCGAELLSNSRFCSACGKEQSPQKKSPNGASSVVFMIISAIIALVIFFISISDNPYFDKTPFTEALIASPILGLLIGGMMSGLLHIGSVYKKIKNLLYIPAFGWIIFICLIIGIPLYGGWIFMLCDFFKYLKARKQAKK